MEKEKELNELDVMKELVHRMYGEGTIYYLVGALSSEDELPDKQACEDAVKYLALMKKALTELNDLPDEKKRKNLIKLIADSIKICKDYKKSFKEANK